MTKAKKQNMILLIIFLGLVVIALGFAYALSKLTLEGTKMQVIKAGNLELSLGESGNNINLTNAYPMTDVEGLATTGFDFTIENTGDFKASYSIYLEDVDLLDGQTRVSDENVKYALTCNGKQIGLDLLSNRLTDNGKGLYTGEIDQGGIDTFNLKLWIRDDFIGNIEGHVFKAKLGIHASTKPAATDTEKLLAKANDASITEYSSGNTKEMYTISHTAGVQQVDWGEDELTDYRYIGSDPNNYITFNNETWRIIGVFTVDDGTGKKEKRMKIMRNDDLTSRPWDNSTVESDYGKNRWSDSALQKIFNPGYENDTSGCSLYYNRQKGNCYRTPSSITPCDFTSTGLLSSAQGQIDNALWYLGGIDSAYKVVDYYKEERGNTVYPSNEFPRETSWVGKVGLIYPSDLGYTYGLGVSSSCYSDLNNGCKSDATKSWIYGPYKNNYRHWTITPSAKYQCHVCFLHMEGGAFCHNYSAIENALIKPVVYLKSSIKITGGDGSSSSPYTIK